MLIKRAFILVFFAQLAMFAWPSDAIASSEGEELDALHHSANAYYLDFEPWGKYQLPRLFVVQHEDGSYGFEFFGSTASAILNGGYHAEGDGGHATTEGEHAEESDDHASAENEHAEEKLYAGITLTLC